VLQGLGHEFQQLAVPTDTSIELCGRQLSADRLRALDGLALFGLRPSAALLASAAREHLPLVMVGNRHGQVRTAAVLVDFAQGAFELCQYLIHLGHREIRLCVDPAMMPAAGAAEQGYRAAMLRNGLQPGPAYDAGSALAASDSARPTAIICAGSNAAVFVAKNASAGSPGPLSLCCIPEPCDATPARQHITGYEMDSDQVARWIAELLVSASPTCWQRVVIVPGAIVDRGSTAPATRPAQPAPKPGVAEL
jgi:DNA-binding LacI/PurR family transcriptional regulator